MFLVGFQFITFFALSAYDGVHRKIHWDNNWCWLDSILHTMVEMDPIVRALETLQNNNQLEGLNLELFKVLRALQDPHEHNAIFNDILRSDNKVDVTKLYDAMLQERIIETRGNFDSAVGQYRSLVDRLKDKLADIMIQVTDSKGPFNMKHSIKGMQNFEKADLLQIGGGNACYREYFMTNINIMSPYESFTVPKIIHDLPTTEGVNATYELIGLITVVPDFHVVPITRSKNGKWYWYDDLRNKKDAQEMAEKDIESILQTGSWKSKDFPGRIFYVNAFIYKRVPTHVSVVKLLQALKTKLQNLLLKVQQLQISSN